MNSKIIGVGIGLALFLLVAALQLARVAGCFVDAEKQARIVTTRGNLYCVRTAIQIFLDRRGHLPRSLDELTQEIGDAPGLLKRDALIDSWGHPFLYVAKGTNAFSVCSAGPDGRRGTRDDLAQEQ